MLLNLRKQLQNNGPWLLAMWVLALAIRLAFFMLFTAHGDRAWLCYDSQQYHERAQHMLTHAALTDQQSTQKAYRLPGYSLFLAGWYAMAHNAVTLALYVQIVLSSFIPLLVFLLARVLFPLLPVVAYGAGWVTTLHLGFVLFAGMLATESLAVLLLSMLLLVLISLSQGEKERWLILAGVLLGLISLLRPVGHYLVILIACWLWWQFRSYKKVVSFVGSWCVVVLPWLLRNLLLVGGICFHTLPGMHFLQYSAAAVVMQRDQVAYGDARKRVLSEWDVVIAAETKQQGAPVTEYQRCVLGEKLAMGIVRSHPWYFCKHALVELAKTLCALHATQIIIADVGGWPVYTAQTTWQEKICYNLAPPLKTRWLQLLIYLDVLSTIVVLVCSLIGLLLLVLRRQLSAALVLCVLIAGLLWGVTLAYGCARLRLPFEPIMIIIGVYGAYAMWGWVINRYGAIRYKLVTKKSQK